MYNEQVSYLQVVATAQNLAGTVNKLPQKLAITKVSLTNVVHSYYVYRVNS